MTSRVLVLALIGLAALPAAAWSDRQGAQTTVRVTDGNGASGAPAISGDERFDRVLAFQSDASDLATGDTNGKTDVFVASHANPDVNASSPWTPSGIALVSRGLDGAPANGNSYGPAVDGEPGEPPHSPTCVAFVSDASNLVPADTNGQPDVFVAKLGSGAISRVSLSSASHQADGPSFNVTVDGTCERVAFSTRAASLGGGAHQQVYVRYLSGEQKGETVVASTDRGHAPMAVDASHPSYAMRVNAGNDKVAFQAGPAVYVHDFRRNRTTSVATGGATDPVISEQGAIVAYTREGTVFANGKAVSDPAAGTAGDASIAAGGAYVGYATSSGSVFLHTHIQRLNLLESVGADGQPLTPSDQPAVSSRGNEVFFVHDGQVYVHYLGGR